jgi:hypothetical protein
MDVNSYRNNKLNNPPKSLGRWRLIYGQQVVLIQLHKLRNIINIVLKRQIMSYFTKLYFNKSMKKINWRIERKINK